MQRRTRPKFDTLHPGPWDFDISLGVGLELTADPKTFDPTGFAAVLRRYGCGLSDALQIAWELRATGTRTTTANRTELDYDQLALDLRAVGVGLEIVAPRGPHKRRFT